MGTFPVESQEIYGQGQNFNTQGLYSIEIFGNLGTPQRQRQFAYIDTRTEVMHPKIFLELSRLKGLYKNICNGTAYAIWDDNKKDFIKSDIIDGQTGYSFFMSHFHDILYESNESDIRGLRIDLLEKHHEKCMYRYIIVIPAGLRDIEMGEDKRVVEDDINNLYRKLIRASNTISIYSKGDNNPALDTVRSNIQNTFNEIYEYIESIVSGKN